MNAYLFDVDGVLNNPITGYDIFKPEIITLLAEILERGEPIGFISGRALIEQVALIDKLEAYVADIDNLFVSSEFGAENLIHEQNARKVTVNQDLTIPKHYKKTLEKIAKEFEEYVWIQSLKKHAFTVVSNLDLSKEEFVKVRHTIAEEFRAVIGDDPAIEVHEDRTAVNVRNKKANKRTATKFFLQWLSQRHLNPKKYYVFGDSISDIEMGVELQKNAKEFEFVFVGDKEDLQNEKISFPISITKAHSDNGTLEYFSRLAMFIS